MELTPQQWENVKELFEIALEKPLTDRISFLAGACPDGTVRQEVERLLASHSEAGAFLSKSPLSGVLNTNYTPPPNLPPRFNPGDRLAERFRITRFLAGGGMGEVYEAEDVELQERVALKTIRTELLHDPHALERFKREVHLAKQVTHPNVCRIFDLFRHQFAKTANGREQDSLLFVAMELLEGETLEERLRREQRINMAEAAPIASQMAAGLGAAHEAGVLHRDFKPGNVLLVPALKGLRAVITDFGLALRASSDSGLSGAITETGSSFGTPAYMSPEQVEGKELTPASDVYSFGLVLYQMLTGKRAFEDTTPLSMAVRRVKEDPEPPHLVRPDIDRRWEAVVLHCLQRDPGLRFQSAVEVAQALRGDIPVQAPLHPWTIPVFVTLVLACVITAGVVLVPRIRHLGQPGIRGAPSSPLAVKGRPSVAVLPFHNLSNRAETEWLSTALPDMVTAELAAGEKVRTVPGENITRATSDLVLAGKETLAKDTLQHLRQYLGNDFVVLGSYLDQGSSPGGQIRVDLWLQDTTSGEIVATISEKGSDRELDELATRAGTDLREKLGAGEIAPKEAASVRASLPSNPEAVRLYSEGLARMRVFDAQAARALLEQAAAADPQSAMVHSALADVWSTQGYDEKARVESKRALDLSSGLSREERLWIEGRYWELNRKWDRAVEIYRTLFDFFPDNINYGLRLAAAEKQARTPDEALATLAALRQLPSPDGSDPRIDLQQADVYDVKGAYQQQHSAAEAAAARARAIGAKLLLARALTQAARSLEKQGNPDVAISKAKEAIQIATAAGERAEVAKALTVIGIVRFDQGNFSEAAKVYHQALVIQQETGDRRGAATTLNDIANALGQQGDLAGSVKMLEESRAMFREVGDKHSATAVLGSMAAMTILQGDLPRARKMLEEGLASSRAIGDQERTSTAQFNLGEVLRLQGDLQPAQERYEESAALSKTIGDQSGVAYAMVGAGDVLAAEGDLVGARKRYAAALALRNQIGEKGTAAETQLSLANLSLEEGHAKDVESVVRDAREEFRKEGMTDDEILSFLLLSRVRLAEGRVADAGQEIVSARDLLIKSQDFSVRLRAAIVSAQVEAASERYDEATRGLREAIARAEKSGYAGLRLEGQLALGEVEIASGKPSAGRFDLTAVKQDADARGYGLIAAKAERATKKAGGP